MSGERGCDAELPPTARQALNAIAQGVLTSEALVDAILERIEASDGEGMRAYLSVDRDGAMESARASDKMRTTGTVGLVAGIPVAVKDLFDIEGQVTAAGSRVLSRSEPAAKDAVAVERLKASGGVIIGRSHMNEFAFSALGTNPHFLQPRAPFDRDCDGGWGRSPGGSTSGGAVAVADGLAYAALGSDTAGSTRIPAAFCGVTGWRPSQGRMPGEGAFPLARSFDTPGLITRNVDDCRLFDAVLTGGAAQTRSPSLKSMRIGVAQGMPFDALSPEVSFAIQRALATLADSGARIDPFPSFNWDEPGDALRAGQVTAVEGLVSHGSLFERRDEYDPRVVARLELGSTVTATDYVRAQRRIENVRRQFDLVAGHFDAIVMPTVAIIAPRLAELEEDDRFFATNALALRNTMIASVLDLPAISLPVHPPGGAPVGLMLVGRRADDHRLLAFAQTIENSLSGN